MYLRTSHPILYDLAVFGYWPGIIRGIVLRRLEKWICLISYSRHRSLLQILQRREAASGALGSNTGGSMVSRGLAFAQRAVKELRPLRGGMVVNRTTSLTARLVAAKYSIWSPAAAPFPMAGFHRKKPAFLSNDWGRPQYFSAIPGTGGSVTLPGHLKPKVRRKSF